MGVCRGGGGAARRGSADLRCELGGGVLLQDLDDLRALPILGDVQRRAATLRRGGGRVEVEAAATGEGRAWAGRRGEAARRLRRPPPPPQPRPSPDPPRRPPRPSAPSLTCALRLASAPALSSDSTQGAWPLAAAECSAVHLNCRDAAAAPHTRVSGGQRAGGRRVPEAGATPKPTARPPQPQPRSLAWEPGG